MVDFGTKAWQVIPGALSTVAALHESNEAVVPEALGLNARPAALHRLDHVVSHALQQHACIHEYRDSCVVVLAFLQRFHMIDGTERSEISEREEEEEEGSGGVQGKRG